MKPLILALLLFAQQDDRYSIDAAIEDAQADGKPVLRVTGTTNLPDKARLTLTVYYHRMIMGKHLMNRIVAVKEGKFTQDFPVYGAENLPGRQIVTVQFNPYTQEYGVKQEMGKHLKAYEKDAILDIGDAEALRKSRARIHRRLSGEINKLRTVSLELETAFKEQLKNRDLKSWQKQSGDWDKRVDEAVNSSHNVAEYKALDIAHISDSMFPDTAKAIEYMMEQATLALRGENKDPNILVTLDKGHKFVRRAVEQMTLMLGTRKASPPDLREQIKRLMKRLETGMHQARFMKESPKQDPVVFRGIASDFRKNCAAAVFRIQEISPERLKKESDELAAAALRVAEALWQTAIATAEKRTLDPINKALKDTGTARLRLLEGIAAWEKEKK